MGSLFFNGLAYRDFVSHGLESREKEDKLEITLEVPGCGVEDLNVSVVSKNCLLINEKTIEVSDLYNVDECTAKIKNGLLTLTIPKKNHKKIAVIGV